MGEIDIIEGVNLMTFNQMALHTSEGCTAASNTNMTGTALLNNCADIPAGGCTVVRGTTLRERLSVEILFGSLY